VPESHWLIEPEGPGNGSQTAGAESRGGAWPIRSGSVPALADGFNARPETVPDLVSSLVPGAAVVLVPAATPGEPEGTRDWLRSAGKTQLAVYTAGALWRARAVDLLIWISASSRASVLSGYMHAAVEMGSDPGGDAGPIAENLIGWLSETSRSWLVVLDDLRDAADVEGLWPDGPAGRLLITSPDPASVPGGRRTLVVPVPIFSPREALDFVNSRFEANPDQRNGALDLVNDLHSEPVALTHARAVIACSGLSCRDYRQYYAQWLGQLAPSGGPAGAVTWALSAEYADQLTPGAKGILALASYLDGRGIPGAVLTTSAACNFLTGANAGQSPDPEHAWRAALALEQAGLLSIDGASTPPTARITQAVQAAFRAALAQEQADRAVQAAADALLEAWPKDEPPSRIAAELRSCVASLLQVAGDALWAGGRCHQVLFLAGQSMDGAGLCGPAAVHWRELVTNSERVLGPGNPDSAVAGPRLADALLAAGQAADAAIWYQWVVTGRVGQLGPDHPAVTSAKVGLGRALVAAGRPAEAVGVLSGAVEDIERSRGADHIDALEARDACASACIAAGNSTEAVRLYKRSLSDRERLQGPQHPDTVAISMELADAYLSAGQVKDAVSQAKRNLADRERVLGKDHAGTFAARGRLAAVYSGAGKPGSALQLQKETHAACLRTLGPDHRDTLACKRDLARCYYASGRLSDARSLLKDAITRADRNLPPGDSLPRALRQSLADITGPA
jgi:tetratricopeptide (TPR) repeat protein